MTEFNLLLMTIDSENLGIPDPEVTALCSMPSNEFGRLCKEFLGLSESIRIEANKENIRFSIITGEVGTVSVMLSHQDTGS